MNIDQTAKDLIKSLPDEQLENLLSRISMSMPWQLESDRPRQDADGFDTGYPGTLPMTSEELNSYGREDLLRECRNKADGNPMVSTAVRGLQGRLTGRGFETTSEIFKIQQVIDKTEEDRGTGYITFGPSMLPGRLLTENSDWY